MKLFLRGWILMVVGIALAASPCWAQFHDNKEALEIRKEQKGAFIRDIYEYPNCLIGYIKVQYDIRVKDEKPVVTTSMEWKGGPGAKPDCLPQGTVVALAVNSFNGGRAYINLTPGIPKSAEGFGKEVSQTLEWDKLLCGWGRRHSKNCFPAADAKAFIESGYAVVELELWAP